MESNPKSAFSKNQLRMHIGAIIFFIIIAVIFILLYIYFPASHFLADLSGVCNSGNRGFKCGGAGSQCIQNYMGNDSCCYVSGLSPTSGMGTCGGIGNIVAQSCCVRDNNGNPTDCYIHPMGYADYPLIKEQGDCCPEAIDPGTNELQSQVYGGGANQSCCAPDAAGNSRLCGTNCCVGIQTCDTVNKVCTFPYNSVQVCGDGQCNGSETCASCPQDCGVCPPSCGDGQCNGSETCASCPQDCGKCPAVVPPVAPPSISGTIISAAQEVGKTVTQTSQQVKQIVNTPQGSVATKVVSTTGVATTVVMVASSSFASPLSFPELFLIPTRLLGLILSYLGLRKRRSWGTVYDSVTKQPIDPAYVEIKKSQGQNDVASAITDIDGRYGFLVAQGVYEIVANKTNYLFPSQKLAGKTRDELYDNLYFGGPIEVAKKDDVIYKNIPLDPIGFDWNEFEKKQKNLMKFYSRWDIIFRRASDFFYVIGFIIAIIAFLAAPHPYNIIIIGLYLLLLIFRVLGLKPRPFGYIIDKATGLPLSFSIIRIFYPDNNRELGFKVADKYGRYYCLVPKGQYYIKIEKKNDDGSYSSVYTSGIIDASKKGIIKEKFKI